MNTSSQNTPKPSQARRYRDVWQSALRGMKLHCPSCGTGRMFGKYLKVNDQCPDCQEHLHHQRADDAPAYFTILIVAHIVVALVLVVERGYEPPYWVHVVTWPTLTIALSLFLLPRIKGALVGYQWANYMHGFDPDAPDEDEMAKGAPLT